jgi:hypothetical protein
MVCAVGIDPDEVHCRVDKKGIQGLDLFPFRHPPPDYGNHPFNEAMFYHQWSPCLHFSSFEKVQINSDIRPIVSNFASLFNQFPNIQLYLNISDDL